MAEPLDYSVLAEARVGPTDMSRLLKVSRVTASLWVNGHTTPSPLVNARVREFLDAVGKAYDAGELPVPFGVSRRERGMYLTRTLERHRAQVA